METDGTQLTKVDKAQLALYVMSLSCLVINLVLRGQAEFLRLFAVLGIALYVLVSSLSATSSKPVYRVADALLALALLSLLKPTVWAAIAVLILIAVSRLEHQRKLAVLILGCFLLMTHSAASISPSVWERL